MSRLPLRHLTTSRLTASTAASQMLQTFHNKSLTRRQVLDANQLHKLSLTLNRNITSPPPSGTPIPPAHHLIYFTPSSPENDLGPDGTDRTFNAPSPFTRRMWAGGRMSWTGELRVGDEVEEQTRLLSATAKKSKSVGEMVLVEVEKEFRGPKGVVVDTRSWVFRPEIETDVGEIVPGVLSRTPTTIVDIPAKDTGDYPIRQLMWSPVGLFRFSALTFNGHKIHYDAGWSQGVEGHPGVVVHGPLNLINIMDYWGDVHGKTSPRSVTYRAMAPLYAGDTYTIRTKGVSDSVFDIVAEKQGTVCMKAQVTG
ncbi:C6 transcription factor [Pochonia chlamydosporia 170]|uniref:C6 transcription factor n=1 Tax=Pochonia chlamydosporia 170 TaxID=1380566 RepID=A0A179F4S4_METCM|nr:C6 transcription factor [Pochonia chlamydosporia 170]OAQ60109.1 C6 transcription factor [Pochonia chlamydosporia 170]